MAGSSTALPLTAIPPVGGRGVSGFLPQPIVTVPVEEWDDLPPGLWLSPDDFARVYFHQGQWQLRPPPRGGLSGEYGLSLDLDESRNPASREVRFNEPSDGYMAVSGQSAVVPSPEFDMGDSDSLVWATLPVAIDGDGGPVFYDDFRYSLSASCVLSPRSSTRTYRRTLGSASEEEYLFEIDPQVIVDWEIPFVGVVINGDLQRTVASPVSQTLRLLSPTGEAPGDFKKSSFTFTLKLGEREVAGEFWFSPEKIIGPADEPSVFNEDEANAQVYYEEKERDSLLQALAAGLVLEMVL